uniref:Fork-head domain-containing protein n=1 Tax=Knipowitschia caucasica TaxID=637954 RepID=A0AAV2J3C1_KNICA
MQMEASQAEDSQSSLSRRPSLEELFYSNRPVFSDRTSDRTSACTSVPLCPSPVSLDLFSPHSSSWVNHSGVQDFHSEKAVTEMSCCISPDIPSSNNPLEVPKPYPASTQYSSKYSLQKCSPSCQESPSQFPKPIYSYSILIFMALKNSQTGSLPVSEIYSFIMEHFPYFKTAPDGWKNSVRHNLSLNKCFEKVENKKGNSSRKGCLWALNPSKVDKMQEELHKWRRKDLGRVRRSMSKPEGLDHLLGVKTNAFRSLAPSRAYMYSSASGFSSKHPPCYSSPHYHKSFNLSQSAPYPTLPRPLFPPYNQHAFTPRCTSSPGIQKRSPAHDAHSRRSAHDLFSDGDSNSDIDALNPSLTDLQLQGTLWEELKEDSARVIPSLSPSMVETVSVEQSGYLHPNASLSSERMTGPDKSLHVDTERLWGQDHNYLPGVYSGMETFTGCLSS